MPRTQKVWVYAPPKGAKPSLTDLLKNEVAAKAADLVAKVLKPKHVFPPPQDHQFNYISDIGTKWYRQYFYFYATYTCPGPNVIPPTFEAKFARLEFIGNGQFSLAFMRHTEEWVKLYDSLSLDDCLQAIQNDPWFEL